MDRDRVVLRQSAGRRVVAPTCCSYHSIVGAEALLEDVLRLEPEPLRAPGSCRAPDAAGRPAWSRPSGSRPRSRVSRTISVDELADRDLAGRRRG